jgi:hypothetical protein
MQAILPAVADVQDFMPRLDRGERVGGMPLLQQSAATLQELLHAAPALDWLLLTVVPSWAWSAMYRGQDTRLDHETGRGLGGDCSVRRTSLYREYSGG